MRWLALLVLSVAGCGSPDSQPGYTCIKDDSCGRCGKDAAWKCTHGVVPDGCRKADLGQLEGYDWIVCCAPGQMP